MKIFLGFLALISCFVHHAASRGHGREVDNVKINPLNARNPLLLGSSAGLTVLDKLQNIRNKLEEIEKKNTDLPVVSPFRSPESQFESINSFIDDLPVTSDNKEQANAFEIQPFSLLEKIPEMPSSLNGYFMMLRLKQNVSNSVPTKSQSRFLGNEQQHFIQQINAQKPESAVSQQQPFAIQRQATSQQQSLNNQQMHFSRFNIQDQSSNHGNLLSGQQNIANQQQLVNSQGYHLSGLQRSINQQQFVHDQRSPVSSQQFARNEGSILNGHQNLIRPVFNEKISINHQFPARNLQQANQQQPTINTQQAPGQQGILSISHQTSLNQYIRPREIIPERIASNLPTTENPTKAIDNFAYPSGQQIQAFTNELLAKIQSQALNRESQPIFTDDANSKTQSRIISDGAVSHQASLLADLERSPVTPAVTTTSGSQIVHETRVSTGASVKQHLKTPYANYDFSHLL
ncbi:uncharacterized protein LOC129966623 [Argiope bruennichi]|uniref:Uncharacterized protein n=1 Tax=Argiope bruennichi TaxID=94029 RepID=A0A8T0E8T8_ARGBR|nr:uncharacterized protein LOC129966623 [Argiope bruennichi]KAF8767292.1 hypothetical protein HNY73_020275 [Argiope bruennichi]